MTELFLIALLASGLTVLMWGNVTELAEACRERVKKWALSFKEETGSEGKIKFKAESLPDKTYDHIRMLMRLTLGMGTDRSVKAFLLISLLFLTLIFALLVGRIDFPLVLSAALGAGILPYGLLRLRLQKLRVKSSGEGEILVSELLENYKIEYCNMRHFFDPRSF